MLITTAKKLQNALEMLNLASWAYATPKVAASRRNSIRGWLISPLHPMARLCRWSVSNYLLATPASVTLFLEQIVALLPDLETASGKPKPVLRIVCGCRE